MTSYDDIAIHIRSSGFQMGPGRHVTASGNRGGDPKSWWARPDRAQTETARTARAAGPTGVRAPDRRARSPLAVAASLGLRGAAA